MATSKNLYPRRAAEVVETALADTRVVVVNGARQVGKSTLAEEVLRRSGSGVARFLDDPLTRAAAVDDPTGFVSHDGLMLIDEIQRVPDLLLAIKHRVDHDDRPGQFLLTGSARLLGLRDIPDALPGRSETVELWPLSQGELDGTPDRFVDAVFRHGSDVGLDGTLRRKDYLRRFVRGGYPEAVRRDAPIRRRRFFESYVADIIGRDVRQVSEISRGPELRRLLGLLAAQAGGMLRYERIANAAGLSASTVRRYVTVLDLVHLVHLVPAWSAGLAGRTVGMPKIAMVDTGLGAHLTGTTEDQPAGRDGVLGGLAENFVIGELARQLSWSEEIAGLFHFRDRDGYEVDAVLENAAGQVVGVEVKLGETVRADDFRGLRRLRSRVGDRFTAGFVLYTGTQSLSFGPDLRCLPISALWQLEP